jgi:multiple sugar transport system permease protein
LSSLLLIAYLLAPVLWLVSSSLQTEREIVSVPPHWLPDHPTLQNFRAIVAAGMGLPPAAMTAGGFIPSTAGDLLPAMLNSLIVATAVVILNLLVGVPAAYAIAKIRFRGRDVALYTILATRVLPDIALVVPFFLVVRRLGMLDSLASLIITYLAITVPFSVFVLATTFEQLPDDLDRAAQVDGCSRLQVLLRVFLPLARPALVAAGLFAFLASWNEFLLALMFTQTAKSQTLPIIVAAFTSDFTVSFSFLNAAGVLAVVPPVLLAIVFQRYIVSGLTAGAVKG